MSKENTCCFFGHRKIEVTDELVSRLRGIIEDLIIEKGVDTFLFGSRSEFDSLCLNVVTGLKKKYPRIKRIYVRAEFPHIGKNYMTYLLKSYDDTYYPEKILNAGRAVYIKRNFDMIDNSRFCVIYYNKNYSSVKSNHSRSGTKIAFEYAQRRELRVVNAADA